ncbi:hypothetical protein Kalk_02330 [Ketobacter alkanivorans]|uniref:Uncharacterized protein n=1 Tax=Ketobacter alkanivorans TaxID=1917421 RepID=A0A2K9LIL8_9GAMM|nr:hypothetical protein Kalk_02330 [Ketobacter alkanivorans]
MLASLLIGIFQLFFQAMAQLFFTGNHLLTHFLFGLNKALPQLRYLGFKLGLSQFFAGVLYYMHSSFQCILRLFDSNLSSGCRLYPPAFLSLYQLGACRCHPLLRLVQSRFHFLYPLFRHIGIQVPKCICHICLPSLIKIFKHSRVSAPATAYAQIALSQLKLEVAI